MIEGSASIRRRLLVMASGLLLLISAVTCWTATLYGQRAARLSYDRLLTGYADLPAAPPGNTAPRRGNSREPLLPVFFNADYSGEPVRFLQLDRLLLDADHSKEVRVLVGHTMRARAALADEIGWLTLQFVTVFVVVTLLLIVLGIRLVLRPLRNLNLALAQRAPVDLSPLDLDVPREIAPLLNTINYFMAQYEMTLDHLKRFTGAAAHQIRTPLAGLKYLAQHALEEDGMRKSSMSGTVPWSESCRMIRNLPNSLQFGWLPGW